MSHDEIRADLDRYLQPIREGDCDAFAAWAGTASPRLVRRLQPLASVIDTETIVQETFLRVWQKAAGFTPDGQRNALLRFAFRTARNLAIDELRRMRREPRPLPIDDVVRLAGVTQPEAADPALRRIIAAGIEKLPPRPKAALGARLGRYAASHDSILAARSGMRANTFVQNVVRARRLMAKHLAACGVDSAMLLGTARA
jgi:DNA-directed RNA polymerase specialized sigma24 family protein